MQSDLPWNISGIPTDAREAARAAARREGLSIGEWLTRRITQTGGNETTGLAPESEDALNRLAGQAEGTAETMAGLQDAIERLSRQLADLAAAQEHIMDAAEAAAQSAQSAAQSASAQPAAPATAEDSGITEIGQALSDQLNALMHFQQEFAEQTNAKIAVLAGTMAQMQQRSTAAAREDAPGVGEISQALAQADGQISALSDNFVTLSGSMDLLRRDFREAMDELGSHLGSFDERLQQFEETLLAPPPAEEPALPEPEPEPKPAPEPVPAPVPEPPAPKARKPEQTLKAAPAPARHSSFAFDKEPPRGVPPDDIFTADEAHEAAGIRDDFSPDAKLDVPWRNDEYDEDDEAEERSRRRVLLFLRIVLVFAVLLAAAAAFMAYHHIGFAELKAYFAPAATAPARPDPAPAKNPHSSSADLEKLTDLAKNGDSQAMLLLGISYADGTGVPSDPDQAIHWLSQASSAGEAVAQYRLGVLYEGGRGTEAAPDKAAEQFSLAAKAGNLQAMYLLASAYATGTGVSRSAAEAAHWYSKAANLGLADAAYNLAQLYEQGNGVSVDPVQAYQWYAIAAAEGDTDAAPHLEDLKARLSTDDMTKAGEAARAFKPQTAPVDANMVPDIAKVLKKAV